MTIQHIRGLIERKTDERTSDVLMLFLAKLKKRHQKMSVKERKNCGCSYCTYINGDYTRRKIHIHHRTRRILYDEWWGTSNKYTGNITEDLIKLAVENGELQMEKQRLLEIYDI